MTTAPVALLLLAVPTAAFAQRVPFERTLEVSTPITLDVSTDRGRIEVVAGSPGRIVVAGDATVRVGWNVPADAERIAREVAADPPITQGGDTVRLHDPEDRAARRAVTVSFRVEVPPDTTLRSVSDSGETTVRGVSGDVHVRTQSGAITLERLSGAVQVDSGSGAIEAQQIAGPLSVTTSSSAFSGADLGAPLHVRSRSGAVEAVLVGAGDVDVETGSSEITLSGVRGSLTAESRSGSISVTGTPTGNWVVTTGSSSIDLALSPGAGVDLDVESRSGSVTLDAVMVDGAAAKRSVKGAVDGGGPSVRVRSGSGSIRIDRASDH